jgi:hypothetical protein
MHNRQLKKLILVELSQPDFQKGLTAIGCFTPRRAVNPLFSFFHHPDQTIRWRSVVAMGTIVAGLAENELESARVIMRRMMWSLNDESGGIGWGAPEAMGESMARSQVLAEEFGCIIISYLNPGGCFIEHPLLQRGVLWGLGRLAHARPQKAIAAGPLLLPFLKEIDPNLIGLATWSAAAIPSPATTNLLKSIFEDRRTIEIFTNDQFITHTLGQLAQSAYAKISA